MEPLSDPPGDTVFEPSPPPRSSRRLIRVLAVLAVVSTAVAGFAWTRDRPEATPETTPKTRTIAAPLFSVPTLDGGRFSLADHLEDPGTPVVLNLWASWCPPCRAEMPAIDAAAKRHPDVEFIGVAIEDDLEAASQFATEIGVSYTIGLDERDEVSALYPWPGLPTTFFIDRDGMLAHFLYGELNGEALDAAIAVAFG